MLDALVIRPQKSPLPCPAAPTLLEPDFRLVPVPDPPAEATRLVVLNRSPAERAQFVIDLTIFTDELLQAESALEVAMARAGLISAPGGIIITGEGGTGKTFIRTRIRRRYPPVMTKTKTFMPVVAIQLEETPTPEDVKNSILEELGHANCTTKLTSKQRSDDVIAGLEQSGTRLLVFDESHHLQLTTGARRNKDRPAGPVGDYLKLLYDKAKIAFCFLGKPTLLDIADADSQFSRWPGRISLRPYGLDARWLALLETLDQALPMKFPAGLAEEPLAKYLHAVSLGNFRSLKGFLSECVRQAAIEGAERLLVTHFQRAYYLRGMPHPNPFGPFTP
jgi:hypothetical protein